MPSIFAIYSLFFLTFHMTSRTIRSYSCSWLIVRMCVNICTAFYSVAVTLSLFWIHRIRAPCTRYPGRAGMHIAHASVHFTSRCWRCCSFDINNWNVYNTTSQKGRTTTIRMLLSDFWSLCVPTGECSCEFVFNSAYEMLSRSADLYKLYVIGVRRPTLTGKTNESDMP